MAKKTGKYDNATQDLMIEAAAQTLYICLKLSVVWRNGSPAHRDKAILMYVRLMADTLIDENAGDEVIEIFEAGFEEAKQAAIQAKEARF